MLILLFIDHSQLQEVLRKQQVFPLEDMQLTIEWCKDGKETRQTIKHIMTFTHSI